ncbi:hypothetical protein HYC85_007451 [Camellia sinensis]|uniref:Uncharacterized protein n=1 Tax=Camellia sinensis TaxID=4442 RepID=A0A7J7HPV3_CAMSI|nr:hypothetical protein HYC85_007451 [Camellia sinensis]
MARRINKCTERLGISVYENYDGAMGDITIIANRSLSYTASLSSRLTVQKLRPTVTGVNELIKNGDYVGYRSGSFIADILKDMGSYHANLVMNAKKLYLKLLSLERAFLRSSEPCKLFLRSSKTSCARACVCVGGRPEALHSTLERQFLHSSKVFVVSGRSSDNSFAQAKTAYISSQQQRRKKCEKSKQYNIAILLSTFR